MIPAVKRPSIVTLAGALLYAVAAILALRAILPLPYVSAVTDAAREAYSTSTDPNVKPDDLAQFVRVAVIASSLVSIVFAIGIAVLAMFDLRGKNVARILTWIIGGIGVLCCGIGSLAGNVTGGLNSGSSAGVDPKVVSDKISNAYPSWFQPTSILLTVLMTLALIVVIILLLLPAANAYFRAAKAGPAVPGVEPPYPTDPPYPTLPA